MVQSTPPITPSPLESVAAPARHPKSLKGDFELVQVPVSSKEVAAMIQLSTKAIMEQLNPMFLHLSQSINANAAAARLSQQQAAAKAEQETKLAAEQQEQERLQEEGRRALLLASESKERTRIAAALPPRQLHAETEVRLRGGAERMQPRMAMLQRLQGGSGPLDDKDLEEMTELLALGHQVPNTPRRAPLSLWGVAAAGQAARTSEGLYGVLQQHGLAPGTPGERANNAIGQMLKGLGDKEAKKATQIASYNDFARLVRKTKVLTREMLESDPQMYWSMNWLQSGVHYLDLEYGWGVAGLYYTKVMADWTDGFLHIDSLVDTEEFRRGNVEGSLHQRSFIVAVQQGRGTTSGSRKKMNDDDTWCNHCMLWFPKGKGHFTKSCQKAKRAKAGKG